MLDIIKKITGYRARVEAPKSFYDKVGETALVLTRTQERLNEIRKAVLEAELDQTVVRLALADELLALADEMKRESVKVLSLAQSAFDMIGDIRLNNRLFF